jgi:hypothetical protein
MLGKMSETLWEETWPQEKSYPEDTSSLLSLDSLFHG